MAIVNEKLNPKPAVDSNEPKMGKKGAPQPASSPSNVTGLMVGENENNTGFFSTFFTMWHSVKNHYLLCFRPTVSLICWPKN